MSCLHLLQVQIQQASKPTHRHPASLQVHDNPHLQASEATQRPNGPIQTAHQIYPAKWAPSEEPFSSHAPELQAPIESSDWKSTSN